MDSMAASIPVFRSSTVKPPLKLAATLSFQVPKSKKRVQKRNRSGLTHASTVIALYPSRQWGGNSK